MQSTGEREKQGVLAGRCLDVTYVWEARVGEGPGEGPAARVALDELCECIIRYLRVKFVYQSSATRVPKTEGLRLCVPNGRGGATRALSGTTVYRAWRCTIYG